MFFFVEIWSLVGVGRYKMYVFITLLHITYYYCCSVVVRGIRHNILFILRGTYFVLARPSNSTNSATIGQLMRRKTSKVSVCPSTNLRQENGLVSTVLVDLYHTPKSDMVLLSIRLEPMFFFRIPSSSISKIMIERGK